MNKNLFSLEDGHHPASLNGISFTGMEKNKIQVGGHLCE
jgi:hypothetical protein